MPDILVQDQVLDLKEAAQYLHPKPSYLYQLVSKGRITYSKPNGGRVLFRRSDLDRFVERGLRRADYDLHAEAERVALKAGRK